MTNNVLGPVALVTGATSGIGRATAVLLAQRGFRVVLCGRRTELGGDVVAEIAGRSGVARFVECDVADRTDLQRLVAMTIDSFGQLDLLVNNAARFDAHSVEETADDVWNSVITTNLTSAYRLSQLAIPHLRAAGGGNIINIASVHAVATVGRLAAYAASKGGLLALTRQMAVDLATDGIRVNALVVGSVATDMSRAHARAAGVTPEEPGLGQRIGRVAMPEEVARVIAFVASPDASFVTGASIAVDGGLLARLSLPID